jgi:hypothetical protein
MGVYGELELGGNGGGGGLGARVQGALPFLLARSEGEGTLGVVCDAC